MFGNALTRRIFDERLWLSHVLRRDLVAQRFADPSTIGDNWRVELHWLFGEFQDGVDMPLGYKLRHFRDAVWSFELHTKRSTTRLPRFGEPRTGEVRSVEWIHGLMHVDKVHGGVLFKRWLRLDQYAWLTGDEADMDAAFEAHEAWRKDQEQRNADFAAGRHERRPDSELLP